MILSPSAQLAEKLLDNALRSDSPFLIKILIRTAILMGADTPMLEEALILVAGYGNVDALGYLVQECHVNVNAVDRFGNTPLHMAARAGKIHALKYLVEQCHANLNVISANHQITPVIEAARNGHLDILRYLAQKESHVVTDANDKNLLHDAALTGQVDVLRYLVQECHLNVNATDATGVTPLFCAVRSGEFNALRYLVQECHADATIAAGENQITPLQSAAIGGNLNILNYLLDIDAVRNHPQVGQMLAANNNNALRNAAGEGDLVTVNRLLDYPEVLAQVTAHENAALRSARNNHHQAVLDRLFQIADVRNYVPPRLPRNNLGGFAEYRENSMIPLDSEQEGVIAAACKQYQGKFTAMGGTEKVLQSYRAYLESQYQANPAKDEQGNALPLAYQATLSSQKPYYKNIFHTAWRYLFANPNPWMSRRANNVNTDLLTGGMSAKISLVDKQRLAYLWLAASSEDFTPLEGYTHESIKVLFTAEVALTGRAHNYDKVILNDRGVRGEYDDMKGDKPSCDVGVGQRGVQSVLGHPLLQEPEARDLKPKVFFDMFVQQLVTESKDFPQNLSYRLNQLSKNELEIIFHALTAKFVNFEELTAKQEEMLKLLTLSQEEIDRFIQGMQFWFGSTRILCKKKIVWQDHPYQDYPEFAQGIASHLSEYACPTLMPMIESLLIQKQATEQQSLVQLQPQDQDPGVEELKKSINRMWV